MSQFMLRDLVSNHVVNGQVEEEEHGLAIKFDGFGDNESAEGHGTPIFIEVHEGKLRVHVWPDINSADPVTIELDGAREILREE